MSIAAPLTLAPLILAAVLVLSAIAKWHDQASTRSSIVLLRLPAFLQTPWFAKALPIGEIVLAIAMTSPFLPLVRLSSVAALVLFGSYLGVIVRAMRFDPRPSCGCFGRIGDQRVNGRTVARNVIFVVLALVFVWLAFAGHTVPSEAGSFGLVGWLWVLMALALAAVAVFVSGGTFTAAVPARTQKPAAAAAQSQHAQGSSNPTPAIAQDPDEYIRAPIPRAVIVDPEGEPAFLHDLVSERAQLLVFGNCYCGSTMAALKATKSWAQDLPSIGVRYVFSQVAPINADTHEREPGWRDHGGLTWATLELGMSPAAILLGADGLLAGGPVNGLEAIEEFVAEIAGALSEAAVDSAGESDPVAQADDAIVGELVTKET